MEITDGLSEGMLLDVGFFETYCSRGFQLNLICENSIKQHFWLYIYISIYIIQRKGQHFFYIPDSSRRLRFFTVLQLGVEFSTNC